MYCSSTCRDLRKWEKRKASPAYEQQKAAKRAAYVPRPKMTKPQAPKPLCSEKDCESIAKSRGFCPKHYKREVKRLGIWKPSPSDDWRRPDRRARATMRKAIKRGAKASGETFTIEDLIIRDGSTCALCGGEIDRSLSWPHPMYPTVDHIIPVSRGGQHSLANTQPAHFRCNSQAGAKRQEATHGASKQPATRAA